MNGNQSGAILKVLANKIAIFEFAIQTPQCRLAAQCTVILENCHRALLFLLLE